MAKGTIPETRLVKKTASAKVVTEPSQQVVAQMAMNRAANKCLADQLANHPICYLNHFYPGGKSAFPASMKMQMVDRFYPMAEGGALFVDEQYDKDPRDFSAKREVMKKMGLRYAVLNREMSLMEAMEQLA